MATNFQASTCSQAPQTTWLVIGAACFIGMHTRPLLVAMGDKDIGQDNLIDCDDMLDHYIYCPRNFAAEDFGTTTMLRNKFSHHYPEATADRLERINLVMDEARFVVTCFGEMTAYLKRKGLAPSATR